MSDISSASISEQIGAALKSGDKVRLGVLRMLSTALRNAEVEKMRALTPEEAIDVVAREVRKRQEAAEEYRRGGRDDRASAELAEAEVLREWMPEQLSSADLAKLVDEAVSESGATSPSQMGQVMKVLMPKVRGRADGRKVSDLVKAKLQGS